MAKNNMLTCIKNIKIKKNLQEENVARKKYTNCFRNALYLDTLFTREEGHIYRPSLGCQA
jgi:hypothetical protein